METCVDKPSRISIFEIIIGRYLSININLLMNLQPKPLLLTLTLSFFRNDNNITVRHYEIHYTGSSLLSRISFGRIQITESKKNKIKTVRLLYDTVKTNLILNRNTYNVFQSFVRESKNHVDLKMN